MTWIKVDDLYPENPDTLACGEDAAWLNICGIAYCSRNLTDGRIPKAVVPRLTSKRKPLELAEKLVKVDYWRDEGEHYVVVNYLKHQRSKEEIESLREARQEAGKKGGKAKANAKQSASKTLPDTETEAVSDVDTPVIPASGETNGASAKKPSPRQLGIAPRQIGARREYQDVLAKIAGCSDCSDKSYTCTRCDGLRRAAETELKKYEVPLSMWLQPVQVPA